MFSPKEIIENENLNSSTNEYETNVETKEDAVPEWKQTNFSRENFKKEMKAISKIAWPVMIATIARVAMFNIDTAFLGHLGTTELAGSSLATVCMQLLQTFIYAPCYSLNSLCSQAIGAGNSKLAGNWLQLAVVAGTIMFLPSLLICFNVKPILSLFEKDQDVLYYAKEFGEWGSFISFPIMIYMAIRQYFQALQIVYPATVVSVLSIVMNIFFNQLLIHGIHMKSLHIEGLGFKGSPLATTVSITFQMILFYLYAIVYRQYHKSAWDGWSWSSFQMQRVKNFLKIVVPITLADASQNWAYQFVSLQSGCLAEHDVASISVAYNLFSVLWSFYWGFGLAVIVRTGRYIGEGDIPGLKLLIVASLVTITCICVTVATIIYIFRDFVASIYTDDPQVKHLLIELMPILGLSFVCGGIGWCASAVLEGSSRNRSRGFVGMTCAWIIYFPIASFLAFYAPKKWRDKFSLSPVCLIWITSLLVNIINGCIYWYLVLRTDWHQQILQAKSRSEASLNVKQPEKDSLRNELRQSLIQAPHKASDVQDILIESSPSDTNIISSEPLPSVQDTETSVQ